MQSTAQSLGSRLLSLVAAGITDVGPKSHNEDTFLVESTRGGGQLLMVCDGMGGMGRGDEAAAVAIQVLADRLIDNSDPAYDAVLSGIRRADEKLRQLIQADTSGKTPGTTAALAYVQQGRVTIGWVGDSTVMLVRDGKVHTQNRSHRVVQKLIEQGLMTEESARNSPMGRLLERSLGGRDADDQVKPGLLERWSLMEGDYILLCSDGLTDSIPAHEIPQHLKGDNVDEIARNLLAAAKERGLVDNTTVIVAKAVVAEHALANVIGMSWSSEDVEGASLPPADYRSGILNAEAVRLIERERGDAPTVQMEPPAATLPPAAAGGNSMMQMALMAGLVVVGILIGITALVAIGLLI
jgi:serine/threonine protein phosphatase PrpC